MPRPNPTRSIRSERNLAERIAIEREERGQGYEALAKLMTEQGCPIQGSAIHKIEKGNPPRKVSVDELVALSLVWGLQVDDLLMPVELRNQQRAQALIASAADADRRLADVVDEIFDVMYKIDELDDDTYEYVEGHRYRATVADLGNGLNNPRWKARPYVPLLLAEFYEWLEIALERQIDLDMRLADAIEDEDGYKVDRDTGEPVSIFYSLRDKPEESSDG